MKKYGSRSSNKSRVVQPQAPAMHMVLVRLMGFPPAKDPHKSFHQKFIKV